MFNYIVGIIIGATVMYLYHRGKLAGVIRRVKELEQKIAKKL